ncbi:MAG: ATP-binding protein [Anaerolineae bacterium]
MFDSLRSRFVLSHILPMFIVIPLIGIALTYILETQVLLQNLSGELHDQAEMVARLTGDRSGIWYDQAQAQAFVAYLDPGYGASIMLLDAQGYMLASSDPADGHDWEEPGQVEVWPTVQAGMTSVRTVHSRQLHAQVVEVLVPVSGPDDQMAGVVRISQQLAGVSERFSRLRYWVAGVLLGGLLLGGAVGWVLALNLERPLRQVTTAVQRLTSGDQLRPLPQEGPRELRLLSQSVNTLVEQLRNLEQARGQLLANLVHELGRPLGALRSAIQALLGGADEQPAFRRELLVGMQGQTDQLERLLDDLTGLHGQVLGVLKVERVPLDPAEWLARVLPPWREAAQSRGLTWQVTVPEDLPEIEGDPDRLAQALGNLLSNALKFTPAGGTVSTAAGVGDDMLWIRVGDTGPGITPEEQAQIFQPLYRGPAGRRFPQGMGLGLSIARDLVAAHGGRLDAESQPGAGSRFTIWLPLVPSS